MSKKKSKTKHKPLEDVISEELAKQIGEAINQRVMTWVQYENRVTNEGWIKVESEHNPELEQLCNEFCQSDWGYTDDHFYFADPAEATWFRLHIG